MISLEVSSLGFCGCLIMLLGDQVFFIFLFDYFQMCGIFGLLFQVGKGQEAKRQFQQSFIIFFLLVLCYVISFGYKVDWEIEFGIKQKRIGNWKWRLGQLIFIVCQILQSFFVVWVVVLMCGFLGEFRNKYMLQILEVSRFFLFQDRV